MADYQLTASDVVIRTRDEAWIPSDPANVDRVEYDKWLEDGGVPDPYVEPPAPAGQPAAPGEMLLFDHENRLRALEGQPPLSLQEFRAKTGG
jgi:hypothetical protein